MPRMYSKSENDIVAKVGEPFVIELEGNPTTGYEWQLEFDPDKIELLDQVHQPVSGEMGAGGVQRFRLRPSRPGKTTIRAIYKRSWEPNSIDGQNFAVQIRT